MSARDLRILEETRLRHPAMYRYWLARARAAHKPCSDPACFLCDHREKGRRK